MSKSSRLKSCNATSSSREPSAWGDHQMPSFISRYRGPGPCWNRYKTSQIIPIPKIDLQILAKTDEFHYERMEWMWNQFKSIFEISMICDVSYLFQPGPGPLPGNGTWLLVAPNNSKEILRLIRLHRMIVIRVILKEFSCNCCYCWYVMHSSVGAS